MPQSSQVITGWMVKPCSLPQVGFRHLNCQLDPISNGMAREQQGPAPEWKHRSLRAGLFISVGLQGIADLALIFPVSLLSSRTSAAEKEMGGTEKREKRYQAHQGFGGHHGGITGAHTYFYADEAKCDQHMETFLRCIDASSGSSDDGFSAIKLTALARPQFLVRFSEVLVKWRRFFYHMAAEQGQAGQVVLETKLELEKLQEALANFGIASKAESQQWFTGNNLGTSSTVDLLDWNSLFDSRTKLSRPLLIPNRKTGQLEPLLSHFSEEEELQMKRVLQRMDILAKRAMEKGVRLMVDAEQSYFQPAISHLTVETQRRFNKSQPIIYNTYQCYLKGTWSCRAGRAGTLAPSWCVAPIWSRRGRGQLRWATRIPSTQPMRRPTRCTTGAWTMSWRRSSIAGKPA
ncbi:proline dehydrogenase 1, mitochondrial isoform X1 [Cinclus cinclus]|uniref:proline dehydrogenase 1, mitochondrial isoform X1 n=1 Tax=Cinclus cinclus TaxID=127875 RepID=UPI002E0DA4DC